jgi:hypothetical protein
MASALVAVQRATNKGVVVHVVHRARILMVPIKQARLRVSLRRPQDHVDLATSVLNNCRDREP